MQKIDQIADSSTSSDLKFAKDSNFAINFTFEFLTSKLNLKILNSITLMFPKSRRRPRGFIRDFKHFGLIFVKLVNGQGLN